MPILFRCIVLALLAATGSLAAGQPYPARSLKLVVPFPPGGPTDLVGRHIAERLSLGLGRPVVVDNRPGAAGTLGMELIASAPADGYTVGLGTTGTLASAPALQRDVRYDAIRSFEPVALLVRAPFIVVVNDDVPARTLGQLAELAKRRPGTLTFASSGIGSPLHIAGEMFKAAASVNLVHVPYKGAGPAVADLIAGRVDVMFEQPAVLLPHLKSRKLRALASASAARLPQLPDVPSAIEAGIPGFEVSVWSGIVAPRGTPGSIVARLNNELNQALRSESLRSALASQGLIPEPGSPEQFKSIIAADAQKWAPAIKAADIRLDEAH